MKKVIIPKLGLIILILEKYKPIKKISRFKKNSYNYKWKEWRLYFFKFQKYSLIVFHNGREIKELANIIENRETKSINEIKT